MSREGAESTSSRSNVAWVCSPLEGLPFSVWVHDCGSFGIWEEGVSERAGKERCPKLLPLLRANSALFHRVLFYYMYFLNA